MTIEYPTLGTLDCIRIIADRDIALVTIMGTRCTPEYARLNLSENDETRWILERIQNNKAVAIVRNKRSSPEILVVDHATGYWECCTDCVVESVGEFVIVLHLSDGAIQSFVKFPAGRSIYVMIGHVDSEEEYTPLFIDQQKNRAVQEILRTYELHGPFANCTPEESRVIAEQMIASFHPDEHKTVVIDGTKHVFSSLLMDTPRQHPRRQTAFSRFGEFPLILCIGSVLMLPMLPVVHPFEGWLSNMILAFCIFYLAGLCFTIGQYNYHKTIAKRLRKILPLNNAKTYITIKRNGRKGIIEYAIGVQYRKKIWTLGYGASPAQALFEAFSAPRSLDEKNTSAGAEMRLTP